MWVCPKAVEGKGVIERSFPFPFSLFGLLFLRKRLSSPYSALIILSSSLFLATREAKSELKEIDESVWLGEPF